MINDLMVCLIERNVLFLFFWGAFPIQGPNFRRPLFYFNFLKSYIKLLMGFFMPLFGQDSVE